MLDGQTLILFERFLHGFKDAAYVASASLAVIVYDHVITFQAEFESFWKAPWSLIRALFFLNRYISVIVACLQVYRLVSLHPTHIAYVCSVASTIWTYGVLFIVVIGSVILLMRVLAVYRRQIWITYGLTTLFVLLTLGFLAFTIDLNRRTIPFDAVQSIVHGCPARMEAAGLDVIWRVYVCPLILQTMLVAMILYKATRKTSLSKAGRGIVGLLARDGAMVYLAVLFAIILSIIACFVPVLQVPLLASNLLLPVVSISTSRILLNIRSHLSTTLLTHSKHAFAGNTSAGVLSGVEMSALYLGGYHGGIGPARGVEGAKVREIGNTTVIEVPIVDDSTLDEYDDDERTQIQRYQDEVGVGAMEEGGATSTRGNGEVSPSTLGRAASATGGHLHGRPRSRPGSARPALMISALGATPGWEHWDDRVPTKDFHLPTLGVPHTLSSPSPPPNGNNGSTTGMSGVDSNSNESGSRETIHEPQSQVQTVTVTTQIERMTSASPSSGRRQPHAVSRETVIQWAPPPTGSTIRSTTTNGEGDDQPLSRHGRSSSRLRTPDRNPTRPVSRPQSRDKPLSGPASAESESS